MKYSNEEIYLMKKDKILKNVIQKNNSIKFKPRKTSYFNSLINIVISQFISTTAASAISKKILIYFNAKTFSPDQFIDLSIKEIKSFGLSTNKSKSIKEISKILDWVNKNNNFIKLRNDEKIVITLKGKSVNRFKLLKDYLKEINYILSP